MNRYILILFKNMILMALILGTLSATSRANFESTFVQTGEFNRWWYTVETKFLKEILSEKKHGHIHTHTHTELSSIIHSVALELASEDARQRYERIGTKLFFLDDSGRKYCAYIEFCG